MPNTATQPHSSGKRRRNWRYAAIVLVNVLVFFCVGLAYYSYTAAYSRKLYNENLNNIVNLNRASANAAQMYITSMANKLDDVAAYVTANSLDYDETITILGQINTNPDRQFQLINCGYYDETGVFVRGDYSGVSVRRLSGPEGTLETSVQPVSYASNYEELARSLRDIDDERFIGVCFAPEFTDADTKLKCFSVYCHLTLDDGAGVPTCYALLLSVNSRTALSTCNLQNEYPGQTTVLMNAAGDYIVNNSDFKGINFYEYLRNYNDLSLDQRTALQETVTQSLADEQSAQAMNLFYKNHEGVDCVFSVTGMNNDWFSVTCVPQSGFNQGPDEFNYSLLILVLFLALFLLDGVTIYFIGRTLRSNVAMAERATKAANEANQAKSEFLSHMSHELRTPLNAIIGYNLLGRELLERPNDVVRQAGRRQLGDYLTKSDTASRHLLSIINDVLDMATIENGKIKLVNEAFDLEELVDAADVLFSALAANKQVHFSIRRTGERHCWVLGDKTRLNQVLINLLNNAVKFTPAGGGVELGVETETLDGQVHAVFTIADTGIGMSETFLLSMWNPFEQADAATSKQYGGTGLGLAITRSLVGLMDGDIQAQSQLGEGTTFTVRFALPAVEPVEPEPENAKSAVTDFGGMSILVAEDNDMNREIIRRILKSVNCSVTEAVNGEEAVQVFNAQPPGSFRAVFMDIHMPVMDGYQATKAIRTSPHADGKTIPIIALTADAFADDMERSLELGMNRHLSKPIEMDVLLQTLRDIYEGLS